MAEKWRERLAERWMPPFEADRIWSRVETASETAPERRPAVPAPRRRRLAAGLVAFAVFLPAAALGWLAFRGVLAGGADRAGSGEVLFPTWEGTERPTAIVGGSLVEHDGCLFLRANGRESLALWEEGYAFSDGAILDAAGSIVARVGDAVTGGGGYGGIDWAEKITGETIPPACIPEGPEPVVVIYDVQRLRMLPDVTGMRWSDARGELSDLGVVVQRRDRAFGDVAAGVVAAQRPAAGAPVEAGSIVKLVVSTGAVDDVHVGEIPEVGVAVSDAEGLTLLDADGRVLATVPGLQIAGNAGAPGLWLQAGRRYYLLDPGADAIAPVSERYARERMYDESMVEPDLPPPAGTLVGHWRYELFSPMNGDALAQWSGECEVPIAYWIDATGQQTIVTGERDLSRAPESVALGWTPDGAALVFLPRGACGASSSGAGIYRYAAPGEGELIFPTSNAISVRAEGWEAP